MCDQVHFQHLNESERLVVKQALQAGPSLTCDLASHWSMHRLALVISQSEAALQAAEPMRGEEVVARANDSHTNTL